MTNGIFVGFVVFIILIFCVAFFVFVFCYCVCNRSVLCLMLPASLDCPFFNALFHVVDLFSFLWCVVCFDGHHSVLCLMLVHKSCNYSSN